MGESCAIEGIKWRLRDNENIFLFVLGSLSFEEHWIFWSKHVFDASCVSSLINQNKCFGFVRFRNSQKQATPCQEKRLHVKGKTQFHTLTGSKIQISWSGSSTSRLITNPHFDTRHCLILVGTVVNSSGNETSVQWIILRCYLTLDFCLQVAFLNHISSFFEFSDVT